MKKPARNFERIFTFISPVRANYHSAQADYHSREARLSLRRRRIVLTPPRVADLKRSSHTEQEGDEEYGECRCEGGPDYKLTRESHVAAHFLCHRYAGYCNGGCECRYEGCKLRGSKAVTKENECNAENERGNDNGTGDSTENDLLFECRNCGELKLRAENEECKRDREVGEVIEYLEERSDVRELEGDSRRLKDKGTYRNAYECGKNTDNEGVLDDVKNDLDGRNLFTAVVAECGKADDCEHVEAGNKRGGKNGRRHHTLITVERACKRNTDQGVTRAEDRLNENADAVLFARDEQTSGDGKSENNEKCDKTVADEAEIDVGELHIVDLNEEHNGHKRAENELICLLGKILVHHADLFEEIADDNGKNDGRNCGKSEN